MSDTRVQHVQFLTLVRKQWKTVPNLFTAIRAVFGLWVLVLLVGRSDWAAPVYMVTASTDWIDGSLARYLKQESFLGKIMDPIVDKLLIACASIGICIAHPEIGVIAPVVIIMAREIGVMILVQVYRRKNMILPVTWEGKVKTALQGVFFSLVMLQLGSAWTSFVHDFMIVTVTATVISGIDYAVRARVLSRPISEVLPKGL